MQALRVSLRSVVILTIVFLATSLFANEPIKVGSMHKSPDPGFYQRVPDEIIVKFKSSITDDEIDEINNNFGTTIKKQNFSHDKFKVLKVKKNKSLDDLLAKYKKHPKVTYAVENTICHAQWEPNDSLYSPYQWNFENSRYGGINMEFAWDITKGSSDVVVAVLDTGVAQSAPDLAETNFVAGWDFINGDDDPVDDEGHGTHVTGTIAQSTDNAIGVAGIAPNTSIMPVKVLDGAGRGDAASLASGLYWATDEGAHVINMSLSWSSCYDPGDPVYEAIAYANANGVTLVAAAGNDGLSCVNYPAAYEEVIAVGATDFKEKKAYYSSYGTALDLTAPGGDVRVDRNRDGVVDGILQQTFDTDGYAYFLYQGTSMASPHVAGVAALLIAEDLTKGPAEVRHILESTAEDKGDVGWDSVYGHGLLDAFAALSYSDSMPSNQAPTAHAGGPYDGFALTTPVLFDGSGSTDPDGDSLTYNWNFGDGMELLDGGANPDHIYSDPDTYVVTLIVNDGQENSEPATADVNISAPLPITSTLSVVEPIDGRLVWKNATRVKAIAIVKVVDENGDPVSDVTVTVTWDGAYSSSVTLVTGASGTATSETKYVNKPKQSFLFTVQNVVKSGFNSPSYLPSLELPLNTP